LNFPLDGREKRAFAGASRLQTPFFRDFFISFLSLKAKLFLTFNFLAI